MHNYLLGHAKSVIIIEAEQKHHAFWVVRNIYTQRHVETTHLMDRVGCVKGANVMCYFII